MPRSDCGWPPPEMIVTLSPAGDAAARSAAAVDVALELGPPENVESTLLTRELEADNVDERDGPVVLDRVDEPETVREGDVDRVKLWLPVRVRVLV